LNKSLKPQSDPESITAVTRHGRRTVLKASMLALCSLAGPSGFAWADPRGAGARPLRILILGGTGFIGPHQVRYALSRGHSLTLFNRGKQALESPHGVEQLIGDRDTGDLRALQGHAWDVCIDNPTTLPAWVRDVGKVLRGKIKHYIFISTVSVYADNDRPADESAPLATYAGADAMRETNASLASNRRLYGPLKAVSEREALKQFPGMATIVRPGVMAGPGDETDRFTYWPLRLARGGQVLAPGDGTDPVQFIDVRDLAEWTIRLAESHTVGTFNATGPARRLTMGEMLQGIRTATHSAARMVWIPSKFLDDENVVAGTDMPLWVPGQGDYAGFAQRSNAKALGHGLLFRPLAQTVADTLKWFRRQSPARQVAVRAGLSPERELEVLTDWGKASRK